MIQDLYAFNNTTYYLKIFNITALLYGQFSDSLL